MYRGNGSGGFLHPTGQQIGSGWQGFTALLAPGDWSGDGKPDLLARDGDGQLFMYRGNGARRLRHRPARADRLAAGRRFTALFAGGDFSGDGKPDILARDADGRCSCTAATAAAASSPASASRSAAAGAHSAP